MHLLLYQVTCPSAVHVLGISRLRQDLGCYLSGTLSNQKWRYEYGQGSTPEKPFQDGRMGALRTPHKPTPLSAVACTDTWRRIMKVHNNKRVILECAHCAYCKPLTPEMAHAGHPVSAAMDIESMAHLVVYASRQIPMALRGRHRWRPKVLPPPTNSSSSQAGLHPAGLSWGSNSAGLSCILFRRPSPSSSSCVNNFLPLVPNVTTHEKLRLRFCSEIWQ
ncbi:hypothetical protein EK21DRAFT_86548 [Setomelanomma holmii]|uniref:Uncharacterized protein n=1 Tax=Setomelanomma holmii TaxID=210430 RepID=A0A9P4HGD6_9PLEO|nr:hypothetical protein EK21DRAFT_86548 [Setomelanomma holmii]